jgi:hypothetical protein
MEVLEPKNLKQFHRDLRWSTRIYTLIALIIGLGAFVFDLWGTQWALLMMLALGVALFVESFAISFHRHPRTWRVIRLLILLALALLLFIG